MTQSVMRLKLQQKELPQAAAVLEPAIVSLQDQVKVIDTQIAKSSQEEAALAQTMARLQQVPGIGKVTAAAVGACLFSKSFVSPDAFVAYCGLDITMRQSGKRSGNLGLSRQGHAAIRRLLYLCGQSSLRVKDSPFKAQYGRERQGALLDSGFVRGISQDGEGLLVFVVAREGLCSLPCLPTEPTENPPRLDES